MNIAQQYGSEPQLAPLPVDLTSQNWSGSWRVSHLPVKIEILIKSERLRSVSVVLCCVYHSYQFKLSVNVKMRCARARALSFSYRLRREGRMRHLLLEHRHGLAPLKLLN